MPRFAFAALALLLAAVTLGGCASTGKTDRSLARDAERLAEAKRFADQGDKARRDSDYQKAIELYRRSVSESGGLAHVWNNLGLVLTETGNYADAVSAYSVAAELSPTDPRPVTNIGLAYQKAGWAEDAIVYFERALRIDPNHRPALRYAIVAADTLSRAEPEDLERIRRALLSETDPQWRDYLERQRFLFESRRRLLDDNDILGDT